MYQATKRLWLLQMFRKIRYKDFLLLLLVASIIITRSKTNFFDQPRELTSDLTENLQHEQDKNITNEKSVKKEGTNTTTTSTKEKQKFDSLPHRTLEQYKVWHSNDVLRTESSTQVNDRSFAMAYYSCPLQAGNRMHHFLNSIIWAIVTNRTILVKYLDSETCIYHQKAQTQIWHDPEICNAVNREQDCEKVLHRTEWIPTFTQWSKKISETKMSNVSDIVTIVANLSDIVTIVDYWSTRSYDKAARWERVRFPTLNTTTNDSPKVDEMKDKVVDFPEIVGKDDILGRRFQRQALLSTESARQRAEALFAEGTEFLYGMLFKNIFNLQWDPVTPDSLKMKMDGSVLSTYSIALHSRHRKGQPGTFVKKEMECFDRLLKPLSENTACRVCLMSDRPKTIELLSKWVTEKYNCTIYTNDYNNSKEESRSWLTEHGPNAGSRFYRDLDICQHFTDGFIGTGNGASSTQLLEEWVDFNRKISSLSALAEANMIPNVDKCWTTL
jgi:hypothetical protein